METAFTFLLWVVGISYLIPVLMILLAIVVLGFDALMKEYRNKKNR